MKLDPLFNPKSIAVIGASDKKGSVGHALIKNLINDQYRGVVYPVNNKRESVMSIKAYNSVKEIDDDLDLAIIASIFKRIDISVNKHKSELIAVVGHFDCAGNPGPDDQQKRQVRSAIELLQDTYPKIEIIGLWVDSNWEVHLV